MLELSEKGAAFVTEREGCVTRAYKDSGGVVTIGIGFTNLSSAFKSYWTKLHGHALQMGDTMTAEEAKKVLTLVFAKEYGPPVAKKFPTCQQHQFDAAGSVVFNCGTGALRDAWATALAASDPILAASQLRSTRITAAGKRLTGLIRRRAAEATLLEKGDYQLKATPAPHTAESQGEIASYQRKLTTLGYYKGKIDGVPGPYTTSAVKVFQRDHGLAEDGVIDPATRAAMNRAMTDAAAKKVATGATAAGGSAGAVTAPPVTPPPAPNGTEVVHHITTGDQILHVLVFAGTALAIVAIGWLIWKNRGVILRKRTTT